METNAITAIRAYAFNVPLRADFNISGSRDGFANNVLIAVESACGRVGWGEASPVSRVTGETQATCLAAAKKIKKSLIGRNAAKIPSCIAAMNRAVAGNPTIKSAFDIALYDLAAQRAGAPLYEFLGGRAKTMPTDATIFLRPINHVVESARAIAAAGFKTIKIKLGHPALDDIERVRAVREAVGGKIRLRVDANQYWDREYALETLRAIRKFHVEFCEQPLPATHREDLRWLGRRSPVPLVADESIFTARDAKKLVTEKWADIFNIKLCKSAGLHGALAIAGVARDAKIPCMTGCMNESRLGLTAAAHFASAMSGVKFYDLDSFLMHTADWIEGGLQIRDGKVMLPREPGLGARPKTSWLAKHRPVL